MTATLSEFVDEPFSIKPIDLIPTKLADSDKVLKVEVKAGEVPAIPSTVDYTEDDVQDLIEAAIGIPSIYFDKLPLRSKEQTKPFAHQLYKYCVKKGINPYDFMFDEFGLIVTGLGLGAGMWRDYQMAYPSKKQQQDNKKLSNDYDHAAEVERMNQLAKEKNLEVKQ